MLRPTAPTVLLSLRSRGWKQKASQQGTTFYCMTPNALEDELPCTPTCSVLLCWEEINVQSGRTTPHSNQFWSGSTLWNGTAPITFYSRLCLQKAMVRFFSNLDDCSGDLQRKELKTGRLHGVSVRNKLESQFLNLLASTVACLPGDLA